MTKVLRMKANDLISNDMVVRPCWKVKETHSGKFQWKQKVWIDQHFFFFLVNFVLIFLSSFASLILEVILKFGNFFVRDLLWVNWRHWHVGFSVFDQPKINFHKVFGCFLVSAFALSVISVNILSFHWLSPIDWFLIHFGLFNKFVMPLSNELKNFRILTTIFEQHFKSLDWKFQMFENLSWVFIPNIIFAEVDSDQIGNNRVVLPTDKVQTYINWIGKIFLFWQHNANSVQNS